MKKIKLKDIKQSKDKITNSESALEFLKNDLDLSQENFILIGVDTKNNIIFTKTLFKGGLNWCCIDTKIIFKEILINGCSGFIIGHNHPSGDLEPSQEDKEISHKIKEISNILDLRYLDNLIFDNEKFISFFDEDLL